jgi:hypothetical protein
VVPLLPRAARRRGGREPTDETWDVYSALTPSLSSGLPGDEDLGDAPDEGADGAKHASASAPSSGSSGAARPKMAACACSSSVRV